ncbi:C-type lectin domain family 10 member A-like isoform X1 [Melanotaenia boesemani]|uniref:C-type lectin domain family 10 member A-like isoform X1 n=1 Tax=Melanotaenia boesemani TaxID=1250792 RepID=UPI001C05856C|nr:C-type lectin domain family 10 member A-like isoform X1 [Melanotaenia boesemani]
MEEIYSNIDYGQPVCSIPTTHPKGSSSPKKRFYLAVIFCLGLLSVCLLAGLIVLGVHYHILGERAADLFAIQDQLSECHQASNNNLSSLTEERNQLKANLSQLTEEMNKLKHLSTQNLFAIQDHLSERLQASKDNLSSLTEERNQLKANLSQLTEEMNKLKHLSKQNKTCPAGWRMFSYSCYLLSTTSGSWYKGREACRSQGADLVVIDSDEKQTFFSTFTKKPTWIGLNDMETERTWRWVDGSPLNLTFWASEQPDNGNDDPKWDEEDCAHIRTHDSTLWNDLSCADSLQWICEKFPM